MHVMFSAELTHSSMVRMAMIAKSMFAKVSFSDDTALYLMRQLASEWAFNEIQLKHY
jgi:hypothetical protein